MVELIAEMLGFSVCSLNIGGIVTVKDIGFHRWATNRFDVSTYVSELGSPTSSRYTAIKAVRLSVMHIGKVKVILTTNRTTKGTPYVANRISFGTIESGLEPVLRHQAMEVQMKDCDNPGMASLLA